jgi:hypothetical protein
MRRIDASRKNASAVIGRKPHEPAVQKIVIQLLHQLSFRPNAVEYLQQQCAQQLFRRDRGTPFAGVELIQATVQFAQISSLRTSRTSSRIFLSGWFGGTRASGEM